MSDQEVCEYPALFADDLSAIGKRLTTVCDIFDRQNVHERSTSVSTQGVIDLRAYAARLIAAARAIENKDKKNQLKEINQILVSISFYELADALYSRRMVVHEDVKEFSELSREMKLLEEEFGCLAEHLPDEEKNGFVHTILWTLSKINISLGKMEVGFTHILRATIDLRASR